MSSFLTRTYFLRKMESQIESPRKYLVVSSDNPLGNLFANGEFDSHRECLLVLLCLHAIFRGYH